jgi:hypothetical protein
VQPLRKVVGATLTAPVPGLQGECVQLPVRLRRCSRRPRLVALLTGRAVLEVDEAAGTLPISFCH